MGTACGRIASARSSSVAGLVIGILGCVYGGLDITQATQTTLNKVWGVPRNSRPNPVRARLLSLLLLAIGGGSVLLTTVLSALGAAAGNYGASLGAGLRALATAAAIALNVTLFIVAFKVLTARPVTIRQTRAGAIAAAVIWQALQLAGALLLGPRTQGRDRHIRPVRARPGPASLDLPRRHHRSELRRIQRRARRAAMAAGPAHPVHRQRATHPRGPACLHLLRQDRTAQELPEHRRQLRQPPHPHPRNRNPERHPSGR